LGRALAAHLQHRLRHLLDEQRNTVGAFDDILPDTRRQYLVADEVIDHGADFALRQSIDGQAGHVGPSDPWRLEFRAECHDEQHAKGRDPVHRPTERFEGRGVAPMRILEDHQRRTEAGQGLHLQNERVQRSLPTLLRGQFECRIASIARQREHLGKERRVLNRGGRPRQHRIELVEFGVCGVVGQESGRALHLAYDGIERAVRALRRAEKVQACMRLVGEAFL
jgi:hypothetical protein